MGGERHVPLCENINKDKICIILCWFGKFPPYFDLFIKSCIYNKTIDFLCFTDQLFTVDAPNIKFVQMTLTEIRDRASRALGFQANLESAYKLCDYKPIYGLLFEDYLGEYEYWGHCDCDMIFGDLRKFLEKYDYTQYDKFLPAGHLSLYRNTKNNSEVFKLNGGLTGDYKKVYQTDSICYFDEAVGVNEIYRTHNISFFQTPLYADIDVRYERYKLQEIWYFPFNRRRLYNLYFYERGINRKQQLFVYEKGGIFRYYIKHGEIYRDEYMYIHLQKRKFFSEDCRAVSDNIIISNQGFFDYDGVVDFETIKRYNKYSGAIKEIKELMPPYLQQWKFALGRRVNKLTRAIKRQKKTSEY
ncbi:MAG: hypothetical protein LUE29_07185 [Lachnospiraceae bacterium]|nr:hypothetical protein [Lachnospiraceae bacterium]